MKIIEENTIWDLIKVGSKDSESSNITIGFEKNKDLSIINKNIIIGGKKHQIALLGPTRVDYEKITSILDWVTKKLEDL
jgi:heat-inducible transcriptional repressor